MTTEIPGWIATSVAALLGFAGAWAALRVTVSGLKEDVAQLKQLLVTAATIQAQQHAVELELSRVREAGHVTRNALQAALERIARLEERSGS